MPLSKARDRERKRKIYIIEDKQSKAFKVGIAKNPNARLTELQVGNPHKLTLTEVKPGKLKDEQKLQNTFESSRLNGEWFRFYESGDEILVRGKLGNTACLVIRCSLLGNVSWITKFNISPTEKDVCIVGFDTDGNLVPSW